MIFARLKRSPGQVPRSIMQERNGFLAKFFIPFVPAVHFWEARQALSFCESLAK